MKKPQQITFDITDRCQLRCDTCAKWHINHADVIDKELSTQEWKDIILKLKHWLGEDFSICFSGGEPFLRNDIFELIEYAYSLNIRTMVVTNAFSISKYYHKIIDSKLNALDISLNSIIDHSIHDKSRGREKSAEKVIEALLMLNSLKKKKRNNLSISISTIVFPENVKEVIPLVEFVSKNQLDGIMFQLIEDISSFHAYSETSGLDTTSYIIPENLQEKYLKMSEDFVPIIDKLIALKSANDNIHNSFEQLDAYQLFLKKPSDILKQIVCTVGTQNFAVDPYGNVRLCFNIKPVGSLKTSSPEEIWNSKDAEICRNDIKNCQMYCRMLNCNFKTLKKGISIILCCFNSETRLPKTLEYIAKQQLNKEIPVELIIVNNASTDRTKEVALSEWNKYHTDFKFKIIDEDTPGQMFARRKGSNEARYDYILFCDDDNWLLPDYLQIAYNLMENNPPIGALSGKTMAVSDIDFPDWFNDFQIYYAIGEQANKSGDVSNKGWIWGAGLMTRKDILRKVLNFKHPFLNQGRTGNILTSGDDCEICKRILLLGYKLFYDESLLLKHYLPPNRLTWNYKKNLLNSMELSNPILEKYDKIIHESKKSFLRKIKGIIYLMLKVMIFRKKYLFNELRVRIAFILKNEGFTKDLEFQNIIKFYFKK
ncbi:MAG: glycosyltransferase [Marinilabiliaceae bacterium]|nr:glycosyltransferase [Marinilabiliaceae bacterium]